MYEPSNTSVNSFKGQQLNDAPTIKSETQQFADDFCKTLLNNFTPKQVHEIVIEIRKQSMQSLNNQAEQSRINSKEYSEIAEQITNLANQI